MTGGIPRRINLLCNRVLLGAYLGEKHLVTATDVRSVANEMRQELGAETAPTGGTPGGAIPATSLPVAVGAAPARLTEADVAKLEERVTRLERLLQSTVTLVHTLLARDQESKATRKV
jgi:hypothetical protein